MKQLSVSWLDIEEAFEYSFAEYHYYFDWETGQVLTVTDETMKHDSNSRESMKSRTTPIPTKHSL